MIVFNHHFINLPILYFYNQSKERHSNVIFVTQLFSLKGYLNLHIESVHEGKKGIQCFLVIKHFLTKQI